MMRKFPRIRRKCTLLIVLFLIVCLVQSTTADYRVGTGISDVTGPIAEVPFMGYAKSTQKGNGLHLRQYARAFIIEDGVKRIVFVSVDCAMIGYGLRKQVLQQLEKQYGDTYNEQNLILSGTHTHSGPAGFMMDLLFDFTSFGFVRETFAALLSGTVKAVINAHKSIQNAKIFLNSGELLDANINRSPAAYLLNPEAERQKYNYNVDKEMIQLKFLATANKQLLGAIQWFPVHPTSMNNTNTLVSSDNVGYASVLLEQHVNKGALIGKFQDFNITFIISSTSNMAPLKAPLFSDSKHIWFAGAIVSNNAGPFVAAFASSNLGDVSPNIRGPHCLNTGLACDDVSSTCDGQAKFCVAAGPGKNIFDSTKIIAKRLYNKALNLLEDVNSREITGSLRIGHRYVDMPNQVIEHRLPNGTLVKMHGCLPAMGYSFAAGTTDGPGEFDFKQGTLSDNMLWNTIRNFLAIPTREDIACQYPKPILLATGRIKFPYQWQPKIVSIQAAMIGDVVLAAVPGEFTTMSGRRLKNAVKSIVKENGGTDRTTVIIAGLSNIYSDYIVTPEEYQLQRYEAASTIFGPNTLNIYLNLYTNLVDSLIKETTIDFGPDPPDLSKNLISLIPPVVFDWPGWKTEFGDCVKNAPSTVRLGDTVRVKFVAGHPRNNVMHDKTFLTIEKMINEDEWSIIATDANWETKFKWERTSFFTGTSVATVEWMVANNVESGVYRIRHFGHYKYVLGGIFPYEGLSNNFKVV